MLVTPSEATVSCHCVTSIGENSLNLSSQVGMEGSDLGGNLKYNSVIPYIKLTVLWKCILSCFCNLSVYFNS